MSDSEGPHAVDPGPTAEDWKHYAEAEAAGMENMTPIRHVTIEEARAMSLPRDPSLRAAVLAGRPDLWHVVALGREHFRGTEAQCFRYLADTPLLGEVRHEHHCSYEYVMERVKP